MTTRKFYKRLITIEVISEEAYQDTDVADVIQDATEGDSSMRVLSDETEEVDGRHAAETLIAQGSDPGFFRLNPDGSDTQD